MHQWRSRTARAVKRMPMAANPHAFMAANPATEVADPAHAYHALVMQDWAALCWHERLAEHDLWDLIATASSWLTRAHRPAQAVVGPASNWLMVLVRLQWRAVSPWLVYTDDNVQ
eukprot:567935-Amphidinium_carterae.1